MTLSCVSYVYNLKNKQDTIPANEKVPHWPAHRVLAHFRKKIDSLIIHSFIFSNHFTL